MQDGDFLKYEDRDNNCIYKNWKEFLLDPNIDLQPKETIKIRRGKPQKASFIIDKVMEHDDMIDF